MFVEIILILPINKENRMAARRKPSKPESFVYGAVLDSLSKGLYPDKRHVIREFVQNACDAVREFERKTSQKTIDPIEIRLSRPSITIFDRGMGMHQKLMRQYRYVGFSEKDPSQSVGFRGIGTISGIAVAKKIIVTSSRFGIAKKYTVTVDGEGMLARVTKKSNPPLDELLDRFSTVVTEDADKDDHYTLVELHNIKEDAQELFDEDVISSYLRRNTPPPFDPEFEHGAEISHKISLYVPDYYEVPITLDDDALYKPYPPNALSPEYETVFVDDDPSSSEMAYCWSCMHAGKGQFQDKQTRGLTYRVKNFAVGDANLTRQTLWNATPERAYYFFGELHLMNPGLVPSSDRTDFEDNSTRKEMHARCRRISHVLNRKAGVESEQRRFDAVILEAETSVRGRERQLQEGTLPIEVRDEVQHEIRTALDNVEKRLKRSRAKKAKTNTDTRLIKKGATVTRRARKVLSKLNRASRDGNLYDISVAVDLGAEAQAVYDITVEVLREELSTETAKLERILRSLQSKIKLGSQ